MNQNTHSCTTCTDLAQKVARAAEQGQAEKARVMQALLDSHQKQHRVSVAVQWKNIQWVVRG